MNLSSLLQQVTGLLDNETRTNDTVDTDGLIGRISGLFGQHENQAQQNDGGILPASQDPLGDPADEQNGGGILPASQDPYGDPADERR